LIALAATTGARADELPLRKAGLWDVRLTSSGMPGTNAQHCTDPSVEKEMSAELLGKNDHCSKHEVHKTDAGYTIETECTAAGMTMDGHYEVTGDFNSAFTIHSTTRVHGGNAGKAGREMTGKVEAKWLGECKPDQKPGDVMMFGVKMNIKDVNKITGKLKDLLK